MVGLYGLQRKNTAQELQSEFTLLNVNFIVAGIHAFMTTKRNQIPISRPNKLSF